MANNLFFWDIYSQSRISSTGFKLYDKPTIALGEKASWEFRAKTNTSGTIAAVDLSSCTTFEAAIDTDFKHDVIDGALTAGFSGAITAITADGFASAPPSAGVLTLTNASLETESISYSSWTVNTGVYTFQVNATLTYVYANDDDCDAEDTAPCVRTLNAGITSTNKSTGILIVSLDADTSTFLNAVSDDAQVNGYFEIRGYDVTAKMIFYARYDIALLNTVDPNLTVPPGVASNYYNKAQQDGRYVAILSGTQTALTDNATTDITIFDKTLARAAVVDYTIVGATGMRQGTAKIAFFGAVAYVSDNYIEGGPAIAGITFGADISSNNVRLNVTLASTGENLKMNHKISQIALES